MKCTTDLPFVVHATFAPPGEIQQKVDGWKTSSLDTSGAKATSWGLVHTDGLHALGHPEILCCGVPRSKLRGVYGAMKELAKSMMNGEDAVYREAAWYSGLEFVTRVANDEEARAR